MALKKKDAGIQSKEKLVSEEEHFRCELTRFVYRPYFYHTHWHGFMELILIKKGYLQVTLWNTEHTLREGDLLIVMPGEPHSFKYGGEDILEYYIIQIDSIILQNVFLYSKEFSMIILYLFGYWPSRSFICNYKETVKTRIPSLIYNIYSEFQKKEPGYSLAIQASLLEIFVWLLRRRNLNVLKPEAGNYLIYMKMQPVLDFLKDNYQKKITTCEMAKKMSMSTPHFCRIFKKLTGSSFNNYLRFLRTVEAIKLLVSTDMSIKNIASMVGYDDLNYFIRVFKEQIGMPPFQYRKKNVPV